VADLNIQDFSNVIQAHDAISFTQLRTTFATNSAALARFVKTFPGTARFVESQIATIISAAVSSGGAFFPTVFDPWENWWKGKWSDESKQYHIWDSTVLSGNRYIQPVTQSSHGFVHKNNLANYAHAGIPTAQRGSKPWVDLGINVVSQTDGITGMVLKNGSQHPHWGYRIDSRTLLWITPYGSRYLLFFEWASDTAYGIHGRPFTLTSQGIQTANETHFGTYSKVVRRP
jgi:hypothetical protein